MRKQTITSAKTSVNMIPRLMRTAKWCRGMINLDIGGGRFETATDYLHSLGVHNFVYDPFNRTSSHNNRVWQRIIANQVADTVTMSNVLNVIKERRHRVESLKIAAAAVGGRGPVYLTVYEGNGSGNGKKTNKGFQLNRRLAKYVREVKEVFTEVEMVDQMIVARAAWPNQIVSRYALEDSVT
jgi:hypothetical protein